MTRPAQTNSNVAVTLAELRQDVGYIKDDVKDIKGQMATGYVTKGELELVKQDVGLLRKIVFGFIGVVLVAFAGALVSFVIQNGGN